MRRDRALALVLEELNRVERRYPAYHNAHEGYAVLLEEVDELWGEVRRKSDRTPDNLRALTKEAVQVASVAIRFLIHVCPDSRPLRYDGTAVAPEEDPERAIKEREATAELADNLTTAFSARRGRVRP